MSRQIRFAALAALTVLTVVACSAAPTLAPSPTATPATSSTTVATRPAATATAPAATQTTAPAPTPPPATATASGTATPLPPTPTSAPPATATRAATATATAPRAGLTRVVPPPNQLTVPAGFAVSTFATDLGGARFMTLSPGNVLLVASQSRGAVLALPDGDGDGVADRTAEVVSGLNRPSSLAFYQGKLYIGETDKVTRFDWDEAGLKATNRAVIVPNLPTGGHATRTVLFGADGKLYVSIGSSCNACVEADERRAAVMQFNPDGSGGRIFARGLRNAVGLALRPGSNEIWATVNGRDNLGDNLPPETVYVLQDGADYGWPYCYGQQIPDPQLGAGKEAFCKTTGVPVLAMQAHSAPLGITFYTGSQFPAAYQGGLFIAFHGSWNRSQPTGYKVVWAPLQNGKPGAVQDFLTGFLVGEQSWGRPVGVQIAPDGSLFVSDDSFGAVWRVFYTGRQR